jgi:signal transduction histidine kinase
LITNAFQAKKENESIVIEFNVWKNKNNTFIRIHDNGTGVAADILERLFQPRFTTKTTGSGIGLATVKALMEKMNGKVICKSQLGIGTSFFLIFPTSNNG